MYGAARSVGVRTVIAWRKKGHNEGAFCLRGASVDARPMFPLPIRARRSPCRDQSRGCSSPWAREIATFDPLKSRTPAGLHAGRDDYDGSYRPVATPSGLRSIHESSFNPLQEIDMKVQTGIRAGRHGADNPP